MSRHIYFEIQADNVQRAADFYTAVFGWEVGPASQDTPVEYRRIRADSTPGGLLKRPASAPPPECGTNAFVCSFEAEDFDMTAKVIADNGGHIALPKFAIPGLCWQGYFIDTEGNTFGVFQPDEAAE